MRACVERESPEAIFIKFGTLIDIYEIITPAKFGGVAGVKFPHFP